MSGFQTKAMRLKPIWIIGNRWCSTIWHGWCKLNVVHPKINMNKSNTKFESINQMIQHRNSESLLVAGDYEADLAIQRPHSAEFKMNYLPENSGILSCTLIVGISLALLMRRRRNHQSPSQNMKNKKPLLGFNPSTVHASNR